MADWGNSGFAIPAPLLRYDAGFGTFTQAQSISSAPVTVPRFGSNMFTDRKRQSVIIALPGANPNEVVTLTKNGQIVDVTASLGTTAYFYDFEDGTYIAMDIASGVTWKVVIVGQSVTVTQLNTTGGSNQRPTLGQLFPLGMIYGVATMAGQAFDGTVLTASGSWTVPAGVNKFKYRVWGDCGAGGGCPSPSYSGGGGGGEGGYAEGWASCSPGDVINATIGSGGVGVSGANGGNGIGSTLTGPGGLNVSCTGGRGGTASSNTLATAGGAGGTASGGSLNLSGRAGRQGYFSGGNSFAGTGGLSFSPLGGGGDGGANTFATGTNGGPGLIILEW